MILTPKFNADLRCLELEFSPFDLDTIRLQLPEILTALEVTIIEAQTDIDLLQWMVEFEGARLMIKAEHYSQSCWLSAVHQEDDEVVDFIYQQMKQRQ